MGGGHVDTEQSTTAVDQQTTASTTEACPSLLLSSIFEVNELAAGQSSVLHGVLTVTAPKHEPSDRTPIDVVCVIDVSGSMSGSKLQNAKKTLDFVITQLRPSDRMALVTYDSNVNVLFGLAEMTSERKDSCRKASAGIRAGSSTNLSGGLFRGIQVLSELSVQRSISSVLLMTDGLPNQGIVDTTQLITTLTQLKTNLPTTSIYTFGYGVDHNADLLKGLSEAGSGMYYFIETVDSIPQCFADCLGGLISTVAQNIEVTLTVATPGYTIKTVHSSRKTETNAVGTESTIWLGDIQSEEVRDILFEVTAPACSEPVDACEIISASMSYLNVLSSKFEHIQSSLVLARPAALSSPQSVPPKIEQQKSRIRVTQAITEAKARADRGDFVSANTALQPLLAELEISSDQYVLDLANDLKECSTAVQAPVTWATGGAQMCSAVAQSHGYQRSNQPTKAAYMSSTKAQMRFASSMMP